MQLSEKDRPVRALRFTGPFGFWQWPIVNILMDVFGSRTLRKSSLRPTVANEETWTWTDYKGRPRKLIIQREVKEL